MLPLRPCPVLSLMPETHNFQKTTDSASPQQSAQTPRDYLNKIYIDRYEDVIRTLNPRMQSNDTGFMDALFKLYWDFVIPRAYALNGTELDILGLESVLAERDTLKGLELLRKIAELLHKKGFVKTERDEVDPDHAFELEKTVIPG